MSRTGPAHPAAAMHLDLHEHALRFRGAGATVAVPFGMAALQARMPGFPPGETQVEAAIADTEDALMPHVAAIRALGGDWLHCDDADAAALVALAAAAEPEADRASTAAMERVFNRFVDVVGGWPARQAGIAESPRQAAVLVLVREILHHVGLQGLQAAAPGATPAR